jgi:hypothetical protein
MAAWKEALERPPQLLLVAAPEDGEARHRLRTLLETAPPPGCPVVVLGRVEAPEEARTLSVQLRADAALTWSPAQSAFLRRLVQGLIRRHEGRIDL